MFASRWVRALGSRWLSLPGVLQRIRLVQARVKVTEQDPKNESKRRVTPVEEISELLKADGTLSKQRLQAFQRAHARLFGLSKDEWVRKRDLLVRAGVSESDAGKIALNMPASLGFSLSRLQDVVKLCKQYDMNLSRILRRNPLVVCLPRNLCSKHMKQMKEIGFSEAEIRQLVEAYPMILGLPLTSWALKRIQKLKDDGFDTKSIATSLESSFVQNVPAVAADLTDEMSEMAKYFVSLGLSPEEPLARKIDPASLDHIRTIADVWAGPPIYCSSVQLRRLLRRASGLLQQWTEEYLTEQLELLVEVAGSPYMCISRLLDAPKQVIDVLTPPATVRQRLEVLSKYGLNRADHWKTLWCRSLYFSKSLTDVDTRLQLIFDNGDISLSDFVRQPNQSSLIDVEDLRSRLGFVRTHDRTLLTRIGLDAVCSISSRKLAALLQKTIDDYRALAPNTMPDEE